MLLNLFCAVVVLIQITGTLDWAASTLETYKQTCLTELYKNTTLSEYPDNGTQSIADQIQAILCPGVPTCSNQRTGTDGELFYILCSIY